MKVKEVFLLLSMAVCSACQLPVQAQSELKVLKRSSHCSVAEPTLRQLHTAEEIEQVFAPAAVLQAGESVPMVDFSSQAVMLLAMGQKPSAGYRIDIDPSRFSWSAQTIRLSVSFSSPENEMAATVMTSPCLVFVVRRDGWQEIIAGDTGLVYRR